MPAPIAGDLTFNIHQGLQLNVAAANGMLSNASDADGDSLTAVINTTPTYGSFMPSADGSFTYTPAAGFVGTDSFIYKANDGAEDSNLATVTINVTDTAPIATAATYSIHQGQQLSVSAANGMLSNASDADGDSLTAVINTTPTHGSFMPSADGSFTYTSAAGFVGTDTFIYKANDGAEDSNLATVTINVTNPVTVGLTNPGDQTNLGGDAVSLATSATDSAGHALVYSATGLPIGLSIDASTGAITGTVDDYADVASTYSATVTATDSAAAVSDSKTLTWTVNFLPVVSLASTQFDGSGGTSETIEVDLNRVSTSDVTVAYATTDGTANAGTDYTGASSTLTIPAGQKSGTFTVALTSETAPQSSKAFTIALSSPTNAKLGTDNAATDTVFASFIDDAANLTALNGKSTEINDGLAEIGAINAPNTLLAPVGVSILGTSGLANLRGGIATNLANNASYATNLRSYENAIPSLVAQVTAVLAEADSVIRSAEAAANASQGEQFRIEGIGSDMDNLNRRLGSMDALLEIEIQGLGTFIGPNKPMAGLDQRRVAAWITTLQIQSVLISHEMSYADEVYSDHITDEPPNGNTVIPPLNTAWEVMHDTLLADVQYRESQASSFNDLMNANDDYNGNLTNFMGQAGIMCTDTGDGTNANAENLVNSATAATTAVGTDAFALRGIRSILREAKSELVSVQAMSDYQYNELLNSNDVPQAWWDNLETVDSKVSASLTAVDTVLAAVNTVLATL